MADDTTVIIEQAMKDATEAGTFPASDDDTTPDDTSTTDTGDDDGHTEDDHSDATTDTDPDMADKDATAQPEPDEIDKLLDSEGIKPTVENKRTNRIPYPRTKKIISNALKARDDKYTTDLKTHVGEMTLPQVKERLSSMASIDALIASDADGSKYMEILAKNFPEKYGKYFEAGKKPAIESAKADAGTGRPGPNVTLPDGSKGYDDAGIDALLEWNSSRTAERVTKQFEERIKPLAAKHDAEEAYKQRVPIIEKAIADAKGIYGDKLFDDNLKEIQEYLGANPTMHFAIGVAHVLVPKMKADRSRIRSEYAAELKAKAGAASSTATSRSTKADLSANPTTEEVIWASMREAGLK